MIQPATLPRFDHPMTAQVRERAAQARTGREVANIVFEALFAEDQSGEDVSLEHAKQVLVAAWRSSGLRDQVRAC